MVNKLSGLGRGLGSLIPPKTERAPTSVVSAVAAPAAVGKPENRVVYVPVVEIVVNPEQPRLTFRHHELEDLTNSIREHGIIQPLVVSQKPGGGYELIAGERRLRAAGLAGLEYIPALVRPADEIASLEIALAENVAREDLNSIEEAQAYASLVDEFGLTHERIAELVGRSRVAVTNLLRLLELPDDVRLMLEQGELSEGHGRALLALPDHGQRRKTARLVASQGLSVRQTEALVKKLNEEAPGGAAPAARPPAGADFSDLVDELYGLLETPVRIRSGKRGGTIQIAFKSRGELERLVGLLRSLGD
jgi:ParB family chromosome partitioning protein